MIEQPLRWIWHTAGTNEKLQWKRKGELLRLLVVFVCVCVMCDVCNLMACFFRCWHMRMHSHSNLHIKRAPLFTNCHKAVLSETHHSRETFIVSPANWGITGVFSPHHFCDYLWNLKARRIVSYRFSLQVWWKQVWKMTWLSNASFPPAMVGEFKVFAFWKQQKFSLLSDWLMCFLFEWLIVSSGYLTSIL